MNSLKFNKYEIILLKHYYKINLLNNINKLDEFIKNLYLIKSCERENNGEVLTPVWLVNQMLDKLEKFYPGIFKNKSLKYFDHSAGVGIFFIELYKRLINNGIKKEYILKNMLYFSEYNKKNVFILKMIFGKDANINEGDTLKLNIKEKWNIDKFDVILGNPPYNLGSIRSSKKGKQIDSKHITIWPEFIKYSFKCLKENGFLIQIHPLTWIKKDYECYDLLMKNQIYYLELWNAGYSKIQFNGHAENPVSWYIIQNKKQYKKSIVKECNNRYNINNIEEIYIKNNLSLPLAYISIFYKIYDYIQKNKLNLTVYNKSVGSLKTDYKQNELKKDKIYGVKTYRIEDGLIFNVLKKEHEHQKNKKIIISNKRSFNGAFIDNGKYGLCGRGFYILDNNDNKLDLLLNSLNYKIYNFACKIIKYSQDFLDKEVFNYVIDVRKLKVKDLTEEKLYKLIGLTKEEINIINKF